MMIKGTETNDAHHTCHGVHFENSLSTARPDLRRLSKLARVADTSKEMVHFCDDDPNSCHHPEGHRRKRDDECFSIASVLRNRAFCENRPCWCSRRNGAESSARRAAASQASRWCECRRIVQGPQAPHGQWHVGTATDIGCGRSSGTDVAPGRRVATQAGVSVAIPRYG